MIQRFSNSLSLLFLQQRRAQKSPFRIVILHPSPPPCLMRSPLLLFSETEETPMIRIPDILQVTEKPR
ncbi:hypothetical protein C1H46_001708 [Malus baccata]|uniref:Uncharacterized protein n=1 Tax=Malus baccata TaxID=106549 RepID=A0A540NNS1_MALBA|nr:hypothetical protein C1H46_001708 [Malus baccata]